MKTINDLFFLQIEKHNHKTHIESQMAWVAKTNSESEQNQTHHSFRFQITL